MSGTEEILEAYEARGADQESSTELADRLGISKARLYQILDKEGVTPKARRPKGKPLAERDVAFVRLQGDRSVLDEITERGMRSLLAELEELRREVAEYRKRFGPLNFDD